MAYTAEQVSDYLINRAYARKSKTGITNITLNRLLYLAQGHYLAEKDKKLFADKFIFASREPLVWKIYWLKSSNSSMPLEKVSNGRTSEIDSETKKFLDSILLRYGSKDIRKLIRSTYEFCLEDGDEIQPADMKYFFRQRIIKRGIHMFEDTPEYQE